MSKLPDGPWQRASLVDEYSRFPVVKIIHSTSAKTTIPLLDNVFLQFGVPYVKSDNGPPCNGNKFAQFVKYLGFRHRKITPLWPQANAQAERINQSLMKAIRATRVQGRNWHQELNKFLSNYCVTPHASTKCALSNVMLAYMMRFKFPQKIDEDHDEIAYNDRGSKEKMKQYADASLNTKPSDLRPDDVVLLRNRRETKLTPAFDPQPYTIIGRKGSVISAKRGERVITRNSAFFKPVPLFRRASHETDPDNFVIDVDRRQLAGLADLTDDPVVPMQLSKS